jgi:hypothetical protein
MLVLNPRRVEFGSSTWTNVTSVSVGRTARHVLTEWGDDGSHVVFADVPEQLVTVRVVQEMLGDDMDRVRPGERGTLSFVTGPNSSDAGTREVTIDAVVRTVSYETSVSRGSRRYVELVALSPDGVTDPVGVDDA